MLVYYKSIVYSYKNLFTVCVALKRVINFLISFFVTFFYFVTTVCLEITLILNYLIVGGI